VQAVNLFSVYTTQLSSKENKRALLVTVIIRHVISWCQRQVASKSGPCYKWL